MERFIVQDQDDRRYLYQQGYIDTQYIVEHYKVSSKTARIWIERSDPEHKMLVLYRYPGCPKIAGCWVNRHHLYHPRRVGSPLFASSEWQREQALKRWRLTHEE